LAAWSARWHVLARAGTGAGAGAGAGAGRRARARAAIVDPLWLIGHSERGLVRSRAPKSSRSLVSSNASLSRPAQLFLAELRRTAEAFQRNTRAPSRRAGFQAG
jgi:hypothetical protein